MTNRTLVSILVATWICCFVPHSAIGQPGPHQPGPHQPPQRNEGPEFGRPRHEHQQVHQPEGPKRERGKARGLSFVEMVPVLAALDSNVDGAISTEEMERATSVLKTFDKNGDGRLTEDELRPNRPRSVSSEPPESRFAKRVLEDADKNKDGQVEIAKEGTGRTVHFLKRADFNKDGFVGKRELVDWMKEEMGKHKRSHQSRSERGGPNRSTLGKNGLTPTLRPSRPE